MPASDIGIPADQFQHFGSGMPVESFKTSKTKKVVGAAVEGEGIVKGASVGADGDGFTIPGVKRKISVENSK
jgi:hypothetical protein